MLRVTKLARGWLRKHPYWATLFAVLSVILISLPQWASSAWALFSSRPLIPSIIDKLQSFQLPNLSIYWVTTPLGLILLAVILYLLATGRRNETTSNPEVEDHVKMPAVCPYQWLHEIADAQAQQIERYVELEKPFSYNQKLEDSVPSIGFKFPVRNRSIFDISIDENVEGEIYYDGIELIEPRVVRYSAENIGYRELGGISIEQRLTRTEADHIAKMEGTFHFSALKITIKGSSQFPQVIPRLLSIRDHEHALPIRDKTRATEPAKKEVDSPEPAIPVPTGLAFEVDTNQQSDARLRAHRDVAASFRSRHPFYGEEGASGRVEVDKYVLTTQLKVDFENHDVHSRSLKRMELLLIHADNEEKIIPFLTDPVMLLMDPDKNMELRKFPDVAFAEQRIVTMWIHFNVQIPREHGERLDENCFLRLTLHPLGQQPSSQDFNVNWKEAINNATYITPRPARPTTKLERANSRNAARPEIHGEIKEVYFEKEINLEDSLVVSPDCYFSYWFTMRLYLANLGATTTVERFRLVLTSAEGTHEGERLPIEGYAVNRPTGIEAIVDIESQNDIPLEHTRNGWACFLVRSVKSNKDDGDVRDMKIELEVVDKSKIPYPLTPLARSEWHENSPHHRPRIEPRRTNWPHGY